jgi:hypothetical protein
MKILIKEEQNILFEVRVPRDERIELYRDEEVVVVVPLTHRALRKYATYCQWCIIRDTYEWEQHHQGTSIVIAQRHPKPNRKGITGNPTFYEIYSLHRLRNEYDDLEYVNEVLNYNFGSENEALEYYKKLITDVDNFGMNTVYYGNEKDIYDSGDNYLRSFGYNISDIPNMTPEIINIMNDYLENNLLTYENNN